MEEILEMLEEEKALILQQFKQYVSDYINNNICSNEMNYFIERKAILMCFINHFQERIKIRLTKYIN